MHLKNGVLRDLRKSMYNKIIELPISTILKRKEYYGAYAWRCQVGHSILELVVKRTLIFFCISNDVYHKYKTDFICFNFIPIWDGLFQN
jgi:subfamily B ATP-binding cassette protein MsbA